MECAFAADRSFGPSVSQCRRPFDFTLLFEQVFFQLVPSCLFIIAASVRLLILARGPVRGSFDTLYTVKLSFIAVFIALELATLGLISTKDNDTTPISVPAAALSAVASFALAILSRYEHIRSRRSSLLIGLYLTIALLLRSAMTRTYWHLTGYSPVASVTLTGIFVQMAILGLESCSKSRWVKGKGGIVSIEGSAGFLSRSCFTWLNPLFITGYRRLLTPEDLHLVDETLKTVNIVSNFDCLQSTPTSGRFGLCILSFRCLGLYVLTPVIPRLCLTGFTFAQPFLASALIEYLEGHELTSANHGYGLIGASCLVYVGIAVSDGWYRHLSYKTVAKLRGGLIDAVSQKMLRLRQEMGVESKVLTLMVSDMQRITTSFAFLHDLWSSPLDTVLATWLLWRQVGPSSLTVLGLAMICVIISATVGKYLGTQQGIWMAGTEKRITATKNMLASMKAIKMMGAGQRIGEAIERLRVLEFAASKKLRTLWLGSLITSYATLTLAPVIVFGTYVGVTAASGTADLDTSRLFSSVILISLVANPLIRLLQILPKMGAALGCFKRIEDFLQKPERHDGRDVQIRAGLSSAELVVPDDGVYSKEKPTSAGPQDGPIVSISNADLGWDDKVLLKGVNLDITKGKHIAITGAVGSGKSLLLDAILGEIQPKVGKVHVRGIGISYCSQTVWLENLTVHQNVFRRTCVDDETWCQRVIDACALRELLESRTSDETIGTSGAKISGGEKQRLALARAIASRPAVLLLDDPLSAVDRTTKEHILDRLFGLTGILHELDTTVIHVTQDRNCARLADEVLNIDDEGRLQSIQFSDINIVIEDKNSNPEKTAEAVPSSASRIMKVAPEKIDPAATLVTDRDVYRTYFGTIGRFHLSLFFSGALIFAFSLKFIDVWLMWWSNDTSSMHPIHNNGYWLGLFAMLSVMPLVLVGIWVAHTLLRIIPISGIGLHGKLLKVVQDATFLFVSGTDAGTLVNRFNQDLMLVDMRLPFDLLNTISSALVCIAQIVLVAVAAVFGLVILPVMFAVLFLLQHFYLRTSKQMRQLDLQSTAGLQTKVSESYAGLVTIRAHGWQSMMRDEIQEKLDRSQEPLYLLWIIQTWLRFVLNLIVVGLAVTVVGVAVGTRHSTTASAIGVAFLNMVNLGETLTNMIISWTSLETSLGAIARIRAFEEHTPTEGEIISPIDVPLEWPGAGPLTFENVYVSYNSGQEKPTWALEDISLQINGGERIAVCGRSGSGKSSFLLSLLALIDTPKGTITLDGIDISRVRQQVLRSRFHVISQDTFIHGEGTRDALDPDGKFSNEAIIEVLSECSILDKINASGGLSGNLSDAHLSVGETQLFALARTILQASSREGGIVLFDEATSSIDVMTERQIMSLMARRLQGKTVISVLHRLEAALEYDRILVLEKGQVIHFGTPEEVIRDSELFSSFRKSA